MTTGLRARFVLPERTTEAAPDEEPQVRVAYERAEQDGVRLSGTALVVEDNMIIAMDASDILGDLGAENVHVARSVADALHIMSEHEVSVAVLDVNLGSETSAPVADALRARGVPFILASGYGGESITSSGFPKAHVVAKPYTVESLSRGLRRALGPDKS